MFRFRTLVLVGVGLLAASAAWADDIGYVDCANHGEGMQVFAKPRKSPDVVATVPCGERFNVIVYGFVFSQIQTKDGVVGFIYSNVIAVDRNATSLSQGGSFQATAARTKVPSTPPAAAAAPKPAPPAPVPAPVAPVAAAQVQVEPAPSSSAPVKAPEAATRAAQESAAEAALNSSAAAPSAPASAPASSVSAQTGSLLPTPPTAPSADPGANASVAPASDISTAAPAPAPASSQPAPPVQSVPAAATAPAASAPSAPIAEPVAPAPQPEPAAASPSAPASTGAAAPASAAPIADPAPIRPSERRSWEKPNYAARKPTLFEFYGGFAFSRMSGGGGGSYSNMMGGMGSVGLTLRPWLQIVADSSYNYLNQTGVKNVLYGNHFGGRYFYRHRNRFSVTPFAEGLVGGSRADTTYTGPGGYTTSVNGISYKIGGGLDLQPTRHWEIRLFDADYYRTAFGTNLHQNNYWITTGVVLHLFGGGNQ